MSEAPSFIAWCDPGKTTGVAWYDIPADLFGSAQYDEHQLVPALESLIAAHRERIAVGWELYLQTARSKGDGQYSLGEIAKIKALCETRQVPVLKGQPSSARNLKSTVIFLRRLGWYAPGKEHANDAACHLYRYLIKQHPVPERIRKTTLRVLD